MLGSKKLNELLKIADEMDSKVVLIGDRKQFASIEAGKMFADLQDKTNIDKCEMREVIRQKTDQTIGIVASISAKNYTESFLRMSGFEESPDQINMKAGQKIIVNGNLYHIHSIDKDGTLHTTSTQFGATRESSFHPSEIEEYTLYDANAKYKNTITINNDPNQRLNAVVDDYLTSLKNKQECLVITPTNDDRKEINSRIRESLVADGTVETKGTFTLRESSSLGASAAQFANSYKIGQVLVANSEIDKLEKGAEAKIVGINRSKNEIIVEKTSADGKPEQHTIGVDKHYSKFTTYNVNQSELGINDQIVFLKNHKMGEGENAVRVNNGEIAKIKDIDKEGNVTVQFVDTPSKTITFNAHGKGDNAYQSIAHAYCLSEMKSQGMSVDKLIWHANSAKNINANSFYVAATRCKYDIAVYTDDLQRLMMKSSVEQHKFSTLDKFSKVKKSQLDATRTANLSENTTVPAVSNVEKEQQKSKKIDSPNIEL
jgi:hypothetical protein